MRAGCLGHGVGAFAFSQGAWVVSLGPLLLSTLSDSDSRKLEFIVTVKSGKQNCFKE